MSAGSTLNRLLAPFGVTLQRRRGPGACLRRAGARAASRASGCRAPNGDRHRCGVRRLEPVRRRRFSRHARFLLVEPLAEFAPLLAARARELPQRDRSSPRSCGREPLEAPRSTYTPTSSARRSVRTEAADAAEREVSVTTIDDLVAARTQKARSSSSSTCRGWSSTCSPARPRRSRRPWSSSSKRCSSLSTTGHLSSPRSSGSCRVPASWSTTSLDLGYRPVDGALAQVDLLFVPESSESSTAREYATAVQRRLGDEALRELYERRRGELRR